jgi:hypothetical protein
MPLLGFEAATGENRGRRAIDVPVLRADAVGVVHEGGPTLVVENRERHARFDVEERGIDCKVPFQRVGRRGEIVVMRQSRLRA